MLYVKLILTAMFWGGTFVAGRSVSQHMGPFSIAFLRFAVASVLLLALTWRMEGKLPRVREWQTAVRVVLLGLTGILAYNVMFFKGLAIIEASRASLIIATCPAFITVSSAVFLKERIGGIRAVGIVISILGAVVVISRGNVQEIFGGAVSRGEFYILCCVLMWVAYSLIGKTVMQELSPLAAVTYSSVVGAIGLAVPALCEVLATETWTLSVLDWVSIFYLAVCGTVIGFVWYYEGVRKIGPTKAGLFINFVPIFGVVFAFLLLHEPVTLSLLVGTVLVVSGLYLTNRTPKEDVAA
jgi:drug/metabolite transporter (DMT)-like permease